jgi:hypothetical protein
VAAALSAGWPLTSGTAAVAAVVELVELLVVVAAPVDTKIVTTVPLLTDVLAGGSVLVTVPWATVAEDSYDVLVFN